MVRESTPDAAVERDPVLPVCLVIDVSGSMYGPPVDAVNRMLPQLRGILLADPVAGARVRLSVVAFASEAHTVLPLTELPRARIPVLQAGGATNFRAAFGQARTTIAAGVRARDTGIRAHRPVVYFLSDGGDTGPDWLPVWERLTDPADPHGAEVVSFGMGAADRQAISAVSTGFAFFARDRDPVVATGNILDAIAASIALTCASGDGDAAVLTVPTGSGLLPLEVDSIL
ncbi:VWA domain-containing protein [Nocardia sp. NBC_01503]|uniref:vWA domain-containing protein n=1 Tax=Nocardia sp. NBC_01503 TaxID=2975997 RepID=UPI002E7C2B7F|nr:VWA domain-containing protein [Nocardia sp. NBC_01503]WTL31645.1 VWA domain-containing protein [Nocardia sp. NBC_01503]